MSFTGVSTLDGVKVSSQRLGLSTNNLTNIDGSLVLTVAPDADIATTLSNAINFIIQLPLHHASLRSVLEMYTHIDKHQFPLEL